eukprot:3302355-Pleurochrysis_carterae.AAC.1
MRTQAGAQAVAVRVHARPQVHTASLGRSGPHARSRLRASAQKDRRTGALARSPCHAASTEGPTPHQGTGPKPPH